MRKRIAGVLAVLVLGVLGVVGTAAPASAWWWSPRVIVVGQACVGGYIDEIMWNTDLESGTQSIIGNNDFAIDLKQVHSWGTGLHLSIKCDNGVWYGFYRWIDRPGNSVYFDLGRI